MIRTQTRRLTLVKELAIFVIIGVSAALLGLQLELANAFGGVRICHGRFLHYKQQPHRLEQYRWKDSSSSSSSSSNDPQQQQQQQQPVSKRSPIPVMPSPLFQDLALSQLELLASSLPAAAAAAADAEQENDAAARTGGGGCGGSKIKSVALYLPQENAVTGQLEFSPAVLYPHPKTERVFIANDSDSGLAPVMPQSLSKLPGFAHAASLLPGYPMVSSSEAGVGVVEEVLCDVKLGGTALSVPLFAGTQTVGVLLVSPNLGSAPANRQTTSRSTWTEHDRQQVARAAKSLSLALSMDTERTAWKIQNQQVQDALSDSLHQFKNPLQALRTYGKLLQRRMVDVSESSTGRPERTPQLLELTEHLIAQSDRLVERLKPVDAIVDAMTTGQQQSRPLALLPAVEAKALVPYRRTTQTTTTTTAHDNTNGIVTDFAAAAARDMPPPSTSANVVDRHPSAVTRKQNKTGCTGVLPEDRRATSLPLLGDTELEMAFVPDVLEPVFSAFSAIAADRNILFTVEEEDDLPGVVIWPKALQETVINLLDNAFKYVRLPNDYCLDTESAAAAASVFQPQVRVRLLPNQKSQTGGPGVTILVEDNGPGIPVLYREAVFERGFRCSLAKAAPGLDGSGIGLDIARSLTEQMSGRLTIVNHTTYPNSLRGAIFELVVFRAR